MRTSRARFKYALRFTRSIEETARAGSLAKDLSGGTIDDFWGNVKKMNSGNTIDGYSGEADIAGFWKHITDCDTTLNSSLMGKFDTILYSNEMMISNSLILEAIKKLECGKSVGPDGVHAEAIKYAHQRMNVLLSFCFSLCFTHKPANMIETTIVPIIKNKCGNLADSNNYRPCYCHYCIKTI